MVSSSADHSWVPGGGFQEKEGTLEWTNEGRQFQMKKFGEFGWEGGDVARLGMNTEQAGWSGRA